ncbi:hypothetical protein TVAG_019740 [Trichomonas vaginalis G3]|uniref:EamA domain-containing protein n=1 Tax=Trichomonas vaginalis (strain ATCC PRA-98 / G3) TaxID=412133 RepID=A2DX46_TRIV3|nr:negative regulation of mitochondrial outer membrane permeabilization protein [Trichomonas vaginalis G3]EAY15073.1 hypothetical protein TVAG_019740 [Trichomonas vaginalis G3]KAI5549639.1 negative regulation of mitochondrial outer membrane permeabilization protein [Trichomonas vaginalis G3]|eukprot:XP_001327296.1 hypothetical protein [Trichomonas vaginalis G3]
MSCSWRQIVVASIMLATGTIDTTTRKVMYQTDCINIDGGTEKFDKAWLCTFIMFLAEFFCMIIYLLCALYYRCTQKKVDEEEISEAIDQEEKKTFDASKVKITFVTREEAIHNPTGGLNWIYPLYIFLFSACDLLGTTFMGIGLVYCDASVIQILRGFVIVFTMLLSWIFLHRRPNRWQVTGVIFALLGLCMVGGSAIGQDTMTSGGPKFPANALLGIALTLLGQIFSAIQFVFEEKLLKGIISPIPPLFLVGSEGLAGSILSLCIALPVVNAIKGSDHGSLENWRNALYVTVHTKQVLILQIITLFSIAFFNWSSFLYAKMASAIARTFISASVTIVVWITMAIVYYATHGEYGEGFHLWSILEAVGFIVMMLGTTTFNNIASVGEKITSVLCCCLGPREEDDSKELDSSSKKDSSDEAQAEL